MSAKNVDINGSLENMHKPYFKWTTAFINLIDRKCHYYKYKTLQDESEINLNCINDILQYLDNHSKKICKEYVYFFIHINDIINAMQISYSKTEIKRSIDYLIENEFLNLFTSPYDNEIYICNNDDFDLDGVQLIFKLKTNSHNKRAGE